MTRPRENSSPIQATLRFEARIVRAAVRRIVTHPTRRTLWFLTGALAAVATAFDVATSDVASRDLGAWSPSRPLVATVAVLLLALAAVGGRRTPLTYGTRAADATWWRYAGVATIAGERATTAILTLRATVFIALGAAPAGALLALAVPQHAASIVLLAIVTIALTPATVLISACAPRPAAYASRGSAGGATARAAARSRTTVPAGSMAARWLIATRRRVPLVPYDRFAFGLVLGVVAPRVAAIAGGQFVSTAIVVGGLAVLLDAAIRGTTAPATLRSPWWRAAIGTSPAALALWACCDAAGAASVAIGAASGASIALGAPLIALAAAPALVLVPVALRLVVFAADTFFPAAADRRGAGALVRIAVVAALTAGIGTAALLAGAHGAGAAIAAATAALLAVVTVAAWCCSVRLPAAVA